MTYYVRAWSGALSNSQQVFTHLYLEFRIQLAPSSTEKAFSWLWRSFRLLVMKSSSFEWHMYHSMSAPTPRKNILAYPMILGVEPLLSLSPSQKEAHSFPSSSFLPSWHQTVWEGKLPCSRITSLKRVPGHSALSLALERPLSPFMLLWPATRPVGVILFIWEDRRKTDPH